jgi:hypothetical protein
LPPFKKKQHQRHGDNGTNFQGASNELHEIYMLLSESQVARIQDFGPAKDVIGNSSHHMHHTSEHCGKQLSKYHLRRTLGSHIATYKELSTLLAEIEACLNSRSLCALFDDPFIPTYLSPGHFLIGEPLTQLPAADYTNVKYNRLSRWQTYQQQLQQFWQRWSSDYLQSLQQRNNGRRHLLTYK